MRQSIIEENRNHLRISTPAPRSWVVIVFLFIWLIGWAFGEILALTIIVTSLRELTLTKETLVDSAGYIPIGCIGTFLLVWLILWTHGGIQAARNILWQLAGLEIMDFSSEFISIRRPILGIGKPEEFLVDHVEKLMVEPNPKAHKLSLNRSKRFVGGTIAFEYGGNPISIGIGLQENEAVQLLDRIVHRFPNYDARLNQEKTAS